MTNIKKYTFALHLFLISDLSWSVISFSSGWDADISCFLLASLDIRLLGFFTTKSFPSVDLRSSFFSRRLITTFSKSTGSSLLLDDLFWFCSGLLDVVSDLSPSSSPTWKMQHLTHYQEKKRNYLIQNGKIFNVNISGNFAASSRCVIGVSSSNGYLHVVLCFLILFWLSFWPKNGKIISTSSLIKVVVDLWSFLSSWNFQYLNAEVAIKSWKSWIS